MDTLDTGMPPKKAAKLLGSSPNTLAKWRMRKQGPTYTKLGVQIRYHVEDLKAYLAANRVVPTVQHGAPRKKSRRRKS
jgi:Helix-turn-helix domain